MARPTFAPTEKQRETVKALAAYGNRQEEIANVVGISVRTLRKHFRVELDRGAVEANTQVSQALYKQARAGNVTAAIFWLKCRARWRERSDYHAPGAAAPFEVHIQKEQPAEKEPSCEKSD